MRNGPVPAHLMSMPIFTRWNTFRALRQPTLQDVMEDFSEPPTAERPGVISATDFKYHRPTASGCLPQTKTCSSPDGRTTEQPGGAEQLPGQGRWEKMEWKP